MILSASKDKNLRKNLHTSETEKKQLKFLYTNILNCPSFKNKTTVYKQFLNKKIQNRISKTKLVRRCLVTYKARVMHKKFKVSRVKLKHMLDLNLIPGYKKAIW